MEIMLCKTLSGTILPAYDTDKDNLKRFKAGEPFMAKVSKPRNLKFHKKAFSLFNMVFENQEVYNNLDYLRKDLTIEAGYYEERVNIHGEVVKEAKSISFAAMDDLDFGTYYNAVIDAICRSFNFDKQGIIDNVAQYA